ncbi:hypothetical protein AUK04_05105 [Candidatus Roizmanbacteria bacterium CG2_30_33_16]|uniref:SCP domain-containing protein n=5 Tax=Candidatus Roizmaniibacteriota TaxID=1752723 RepID=A0A2H0C3M8_9BACT|nr:MAG: hypothetical protein AUK04_05105 [Candidatus Roizmanbacteria bacterium CG2_30_33_16]PIP64517.1 MAG: hypothetical protein COW96_02090 [Candidatus Roizmanbacteria bacterium CG22_combo_CG10-13_8_21_14_all_33_16]PJB87891.1 MAG: hypothetical protein CO083_04575 [Candidatus Roizmanbacteria bacterium CG_4_9_14_0_8_um_filter_34_12]
MAIKDRIAHFFVPKESNNYRAKSISLDFLGVYLLIAFCLTFVVKNGSVQFNHVLGLATDISIQKLIQLTNNQRQKYNLSSLNYNDKLSQAAQKKAEDMFAKNYWAHYGPNGIAPWNFIMDSGYQYEYAGENLAKNFLFSQGVVDAWMDSPTHRANVLRKEYSDVGFAVVNGVLNGEETTLVVQMFGKPMANSSLLPIKTAQAANPVLHQIPQTNLKTQSIVNNNVMTPQLSSTQLKVDFSLIFFGLLIVLFGLDLYFASRMHVIRVSGKSLAHLFFLGAFIFGIMLFISHGNIPDYAAFIKPH